MFSPPMNNIVKNGNVNVIRMRKIHDRSLGVNGWVADMSQTFHSVPVSAWSSLLSQH